MQGRSSFLVSLCLHTPAHGTRSPPPRLLLAPLRAVGAIAALRPSLARLWPLAAADASALRHDHRDSGVPFTSQHDRSHWSTPTTNRVTPDADRTQEDSGMPQERQRHVVVICTLATHMTRAHPRACAHDRRLLQDRHHVIDRLHHLPRAAPIALECAHAHKQGHTQAALQPQRAGSLNGSSCQAHRRKESNLCHLDASNLDDGHGSAAHHVEGRI